MPASPFLLPNVSGILKLGSNRQPICPDVAPHVHRDVGNMVGAEIAGTGGLLPRLTIMPIYTYTYALQDCFRGGLGFNDGQLQAATAGDAHTLDLRLASRTALLVAQQRFPVSRSLALRDVDLFASTLSTPKRLHTRMRGGILADLV